MQQSLIDLPAPFGDKRLKLSVLYPDMYDENSALIFVDDIYQGAISYDATGCIFELYKGAECKLSNADVEIIGDAILSNNLHDRSAWKPLLQNKLM